MSLLYWGLYGGIIVAGALMSSGLNDAIWAFIQEHTL